MAVLQLALLLLLFSALLGEASAVPAGRSLQQSGVSCPAQIPACMSRRCTTRILNSQETYVCLRCQSGYMPVKGSDGKSVVQCVCPQGTYQVTNGTSRSCKPCPKGSYCSGGDRTARSAGSQLKIGGQAVACGEGLTTLAERSTKASDCVALGGYVLPAQPGQPGVLCSGSSYAPALNRLKRCLPCPSGFDTPPDFDGPRVDKNEVCQVPPGHFFETNVIRVCPVGLFRSDFVKITERQSIACLSCMEGWSTRSTGSTSILNCTVLLPGYMPDGSQLGMPIEAASLPQAAFEINADICPYGYYNNGTQYYCAKCPMGSTTPWMGATSIDDCLVPPGYYLKVTALDVGTLEKCPYNWNGKAFYRSGWSVREKASGPDPAAACTPCGDGVLGKFVDLDEIRDTGVVAEQDEFPGLVASTKWSCYILAGWGLTVDPVDFNIMKASVPCPPNTYGAVNDTAGLGAAPCKACPKNTFSFEGSTNYSECYNKAGFGYTSEGANQCPDGFYASEASMEPCMQCPPGRTTWYEPGNGFYQQSIDDCKVPPGYGLFSAEAADPWNPDPASVTAELRAEKCPVGFISTGDSEPGAWSANPTCQACPAGQSTAAIGSTSCDVCAPGWGIPATKPNSNDTVDCEPCPYGTFHVGGSLRCSDCPNTPFNHPVGDKYISYGITFASGMSGPETCVPRRSQLPAPAGARLAIDPSLWSNATLTGVDFVTCIESCPAGYCCIAQWEVEGSTCRTAKLAPVGPLYAAVGASLYYKLPPSQLIAAASQSTQNSSSSSSEGSGAEGTVRAKTQPAGIYARCAMDVAWVEQAKLGRVGTSTDPARVEEKDVVEWGECSSELTCRHKCEANAACWGFIYVPGSGFALRGGEDQLGTRTFLVSPDFAAAPVATPVIAGAGGVVLPAADAAVCPAGTGGMFICEAECVPGTFNNGQHQCCQKCSDGTTSGPKAANCSQPQSNVCPPGMGGAPACDKTCQPGWYSNGHSYCRRCPVGYTSGAKASNCTLLSPTTCPPGRGGLPKCEQSCRSRGMVNSGSGGECTACPADHRPNRNGTACIALIHTCPPGSALGVSQEACSERCMEAGTYNDGSFAACIRCPDGMTSDPGSEGASECFYKECPAGRGDVPACLFKCEPGTYSNGTMTKCTECEPGLQSYPETGGTRCV